MLGRRSGANARGYDSFVIAYVYPADEYGCGNYRLTWPGRALKAAGHDVRVVMPSERIGIGADMDSRTGKLVRPRLPTAASPLGVKSLPPDADVVVLQRVSLANMAAAVPMIRDQGIAVVVDMDDDLSKIDPSNPAFWGMRADTGDPRHTWRNAERACLDATLVTVSTPALLPVYAPHGRGIVLENRIPASYLEVASPDSQVFGWPGSTHSHPLDLQAVGPAVARLVREGFEYYGVGPTDGLREALGLDAEPATTGVVDMARYPHELGQLGVGMAPLADTLFNRAKSWLKPLELMAAGTPWVASPRAEYVRLRGATGVGLLAKDPRDWYRMLKRLLTNEQLRIEQAQAGRAAAAERTIEGGAWRWLEAWERAVNLQRGAHSVSV